MTRTFLGFLLLCGILCSYTADAQLRGPAASVIIKTTDGDITLDQAGLHLRDYTLLPVAQTDNNKVVFEDKRTKTRAVLDMRADNELCLTIYEESLAMKVTTCWKNVQPTGESTAQQVVPDEERCKRVREMLRGAFSSVIHL